MTTIRVRDSHLSDCTSSSHTDTNPLSTLFNIDCNVGLVCGWRNHEGDDDGVDAFVPGCSLDPREIGEGSEDFCYKPQDPNTVVIMADRELSLGMENYPLQRCQGDCWSDDDCVGDLICIYFDEDVHDPADCVGWAEVCTARCTYYCKVKNVKF